jgi:ribosomal protein S18 acetylase RimI-like enzyme
MYDISAILPNTLANRVRAQMRNRRLRDYDFRSAREDDLDFVLGELIKGAENGHYSPVFLTAAGADGLRLALQVVIQDGMMPRDPDNGGTREFLAAKLLVYSCMTTGERVGYALLAEKHPGTFTADLEIYSIGVADNHRRQGYGRRMVELIVMHVSIGRTLYARCYPASEIMCKLLQESGFLIFNTKPSGTRELELKR